MAVTGGPEIPPSVSPAPPRCFYLLRSTCLTRGPIMGSPPAPREPGCTNPRGARAGYEVGWWLVESVSPRVTKTHKHTHTLQETRTGWFSEMSLSLLSLHLLSLSSSLAWLQTRVSRQTFTTPVRRHLLAHRCTRSLVCSGPSVAPLHFSPVVPGLPGAQVGLGDVGTLGSPEHPGGLEPMGDELLLTFQVLAAGLG